MPDPSHEIPHVKSHLVTDGPDKGMLYTEGMGHYHQRDVMIPPGMPLYMTPQAGYFLITFCRHMIESGKPFLDGETVSMGPALFNIEAMTYKGRPFWRLSDAPMTGRCGNPNCPHKH